MRNLGLLDKSPQVASALITISLFTSVSFDYALFKVLGISISQMPFKLEDHIKSCVDVFAFVFSVFIMIQITNFLPLKGSPKAMLASPSEKLKSFSFLPYFLLGLFAIPLYGALQVPFGSQSVMLYAMSAMGLYFFLTMTFFSHLYKVAGDNAKHIIFLIFALMAVPAAGFIKGVFIRDGVGSKVHFKDDSTSQGYLLIKATTDYFVMWDTTKSEVILKKRDSADTVRIVN